MGLRPKKRFGQHFLTAPYYARRIADAVPANETDTVIEIGPGTGALSVHLAKRFNCLHCVEKDADVLPRLHERLNGQSVVVHRDDAVLFDYTSLGTPVHVTGNLPYSVGARIIWTVLMTGAAVKSCTFMVQREVAERICAGPNGRTRGFLSIFCQFFGTPRILFHVPPGAFFPKPKVDSSVFQLLTDPDIENKLEKNRWNPFFAFVDKGFSQRRKKLVRVLADGGHSELIEKAFVNCGISEMSRAENVTMEQWVMLFREATS